MPPMPPPAGDSFFSSGMSATMASVVNSRGAIEDTFRGAERATLVGSMTPHLNHVFVDIGRRVVARVQGAHLGFDGAAHDVHPNLLVTFESVSVAAPTLITATAQT